MKTKNEILGLLVAGLLAGSTAAFSSDGQLLDTLLSNGVITQAQADSIRQSTEEQEKAVVTPSSKNLSSLQLRGRVQTQFGYVDADNDVGSGDYSTFEMRRARVGMRGELYQDVRVQVEANLVPNNFSMRYAFLQWRAHKPAYIKAGFDKPTFGYEENTSSAYILTVERTLITNLVAPGPQTGLFVDGEIEMFTYSTSINTNQDNRNTDGDDSYIYFISGGIKLDEFVGDGNALRFRVDYFNNNDESGNESFEDGWSFSGHGVAGPFDLRAEFITVNSFNNQGTHGWYVMPSYYITDKLQGVIRYEQADSENPTGLRATRRYTRKVSSLTGFDATGNAIGGDTRGDKYSAIYLGGNYYFAGDANKVMLGLEFSTLETASAGDLDATTVYAAWRILF